jgi:hypothetical protein
LFSDIFVFYHSYCASCISGLHVVCCGLFSKPRCSNASVNIIIIIIIPVITKK